MKLKSTIISALAVGFLLITQTAHADFRKALDAYQKRDGGTMLKEVKDAVDKKNDDGLMLLLMATNMDAATSDYDETTKQSKSTLRAILPPPKWDEMRELLVQATNNSTVDAQYYFLTASQFSTDSIAKIVNEYAAKDSKLAMLRLSEEDKAKAGSSFAQLMLGLKYLNFTTNIGYGCSDIADPICKTRNEAKGYYWLKKAAKSFEENGSSAMGVYADSMCDLFQHESQFNNPAGLRQAYLWCVMGVNSGGQTSMRSLNIMHNSGKIKIAAPELDAVWNDEKKRNAILFPTELKELPAWIIEARHKLSKEDVPQISFSFQGYMPYKLDVYKNGRLEILNNLNSDTIQAESVYYKKVSPRLIKVFLTDLKKTGFYKWPLSQFATSSGFCDMNCNATGVQITVRNGTNIHRLALVSSSDNKGIDGGNISIQRMAKIKMLVEKYFPTKQLRIELGNSKKIKQQMLELDNQWQLIERKVN